MEVNVLHLVQCFLFFVFSVFLGKNINYNEGLNQNFETRVQEIVVTFSK